MSPPDAPADPATATATRPGPGRSAVNGAALRRTVLVGGGPASASVLMHLAHRLTAVQVDPPVEVVWVDRGGELGGGDPYSCQTSPALLLNEKVGVIDATGLGFGAWLLANRARWLGQLMSAGDRRLDRWLQRNRDALARTDFTGLYVPRCVFGEFLRDRVATARRDLAAIGVRVTVVTGEARTVRRQGSDGWQVTVAGRAEPVTGRTVLLAVGSLPRPTPPDMADDPRYFTYDQLRQLATVESRLRELLLHRPAGRRRLVLLGSSAAASEVLYSLEGSQPVAGLVDEFAVLSPSARLADGSTSGNLAPLECPALAALLGADAEPTCVELVAAVTADVARGRRLGYTVVDIRPWLDPLFAAAFARLSTAGKAAFVESGFAAYRQAVRHTCPEYADAAGRLTRQGRLALTRGRMTGLTPQHAGDLAVAVADGASSFTISAAAVLDCRGFTGVRQTAHPLVADLVAGGTAVPNGCGRGLAVDDRFQAAPGLFVLGAALAGTSRGDDHIWSMENVAEIHALGERIGVHLWQRTRAPSRAMALAL